MPVYKGCDKGRRSAALGTVRPSGRCGPRDGAQGGGLRGGAQVLRGLRPGSAACGDVLVPGTKRSRKKGRKSCRPEFLGRIHYPGDGPSQRSGRADRLSKNVRCGAAAAPRPLRMKDRRVVRFFPAPLPSRPAGLPQPMPSPVFAGRGRPTGPGRRPGNEPLPAQGCPLVACFTGPGPSDADTEVSALWSRRKSLPCACFPRRLLAARFSIKTAFRPVPCLQMPPAPPRLMPAAARWRFGPRRDWARLSSPGKRVSERSSGGPALLRARPCARTPEFALPRSSDAACTGPKGGKTLPPTLSRGREQPADPRGDTQAGTASRLGSGRNVSPEAGGPL